MYVAGIDAHATYLVVAVVSKDGALVQKPLRIRNTEPDRLVELLSAYRPLEVVVETSPSWPWLYDLLNRPECRFVLAHAKKLRAIAESNHKNDAIDAVLLARMQLARLIPEVYCKPVSQREQATLIRHRARLVRMRSSSASRIHAELHSLGFCMPRGRLLTGVGRDWVHTVAWPRLGREQQHLVRTHERIADELTDMIKSLDRRILEVGREIPAVALLQTVPGIGPYRALLIATGGGPRLCEGGRTALPDGLSHFHLVQPHELDIPEGHFHLSTRRGKQFNSMVQSQVDPLTGGRRDDVFMAKADAARLGLTDGDGLTLRSEVGTYAGRCRIAPMKERNLQVFWPEANPLIRRDVVEPQSGIPDFTAVVEVLPGAQGTAAGEVPL